MVLFEIMFMIGRFKKRTRVLNFKLQFNYYIFNL